MGLKNLITGSPLKGIARGAYQLFDSRPPIDPAAIKNAAYDEQTFEVMRRWLRQDSICVDIGCHKGSILKEMLQIAPAGTHYAFEPLPRALPATASRFP